MNPYIAGFVASDGHVSKYCWLISQAHWSVDALRKVSLVLPGGRLVRQQGGNNRYSEELSYNLTYKKKANDNPFGFWNVPVGDKTYSLKFPAVTEIDDVWLYLRGFFEGDGSIDLDSKYPRVQIISNRTWCEGCLKFLMDNNIKAYIVDDKRHPGISMLIIRRVNSVHDFFDCVYKDPTPLYMDRKFYRWQEIQSQCPRLIKERKVKKLLTKKDMEIINSHFEAGWRPADLSRKIGVPERVLGRVYRVYFGGRNRTLERKGTEIAAYINKGLMCRDIKKLGYSKKAIRKVFKSMKNGLPFRRGIPIPESIRKFVVDKMIEGIPLKTLCQETGIAFSTLCQIDREITGGRKKRVEDRINKATELLKSGVSTVAGMKKHGIGYLILKKAKERL
jgi:hypothetical protein